MNPDPLLAYLRTLTPNQEGDFSRAIGSSTGYLKKARATKQLLRPELCVRIEKVTEGRVTRQQLRPDDWEAIWPELRTQAVG